MRCRVGGGLCPGQRRHVCFVSSVEEYNSSIHEKLPLIIGSAAAGLVFIIAVTVLIIVCRR